MWRCYGDFHPCQWRKSVSLPSFAHRRCAPLWFVCVCVCLYRKGQKLEPSEKYMFNRMEGGRSMLTIRNIRQNDGGSYTCKASNKAGSQERELFLKVFGKDNKKCWNKVDSLKRKSLIIVVFTCFFTWILETNFWAPWNVRVLLFFTLVSLCWQIK